MKKIIKYNIMKFQANFDRLMFKLFKKMFKKFLLYNSADILLTFKKYDDSYIDVISNETGEILLSFTDNC